MDVLVVAALSEVAAVVHLVQWSWLLKLAMDSGLAVLVAVAVAAVAVAVNVVAVVML